MGADGGAQDTALHINNKNLVNLNNGGTSKTYIGQYSDTHFGIASNLTFDGSGLTSQLNASHGHTFILSETNTNSGVIHFGAGAAGTVVEPTDYIMSIEQSSFSSSVFIHPNASIQIGANQLKADTATSHIKTLTGNNATYSTGRFDDADITNLIIDTDTIISKNDSTAIKGHVSIEGSDTISYIDLIKDSTGVALIYDSGNSAVKLSSTTPSGLTIQTEHNYWSAHTDYGQPQVDFTKLTAIEAEIDQLVLHSGIDVPSAEIGSLTATSSFLTTLNSDNAEANALKITNSMNVAGAAVVYSSGTYFEQTVQVGSSSETRPSYIITQSGVGPGAEYMIGAGTLGEASEYYPGIAVQEKLGTPTNPSNFRI